MCRGVPANRRWMNAPETSPTTDPWTLRPVCAGLGEVTGNENAPTAMGPGRLGVDEGWLLVEAGASSCCCEPDESDDEKQSRSRLRD